MSKIWGRRKPKFQTSSNQSLVIAPEISLVLVAFQSCYLETVLKPLWGSAVWIMTGIFEVQANCWSMKAVSCDLLMAPTLVAAN